MKKGALCLSVLAILLIAGCQTKSKAPVLEPNALLSAQEATAITGFAVTMDKGVAESGYAERHNIRKVCL